MATTNNSSNDIILDIDVRYEDALRGMAQYNQQIQNLRDQNKQIRAENKEIIKQNKELEQQYNNGQISLQQYNQQLRLNNDIIENNNVAVESNNLAIQQRSAASRTLRNEMQRNIQVENSQVDSINRLEAEIAQLNRAYEVMGDTQERADLGNQINELQTRLNGLNEARGRFQAQVGNYREAILDTLGLNNSFAQSLLSLSQNAETGQNSLKSFFSNGISSIKAFGSSLLALLANPVFLAIAGIAGVGIAFKFWYDYNKGIQEATKLTKQFTGLSGNELKAFRNEIQGIADTFDQDFKTTLESTNTLSKQFGISQQEAMTILKDGFVAGADANGEYLDTVKEYSNAFREAGLSATEFVSVLADTNKNGVFGDKAVDSIKEANLRLREMPTATAAALNGIGISSKEVQKSLQDGSTTTFEVMQKVSKKLGELQPQSKQVGAAIADIFGSAGEDAGLEYLKTLKDIDTNLDSTKEKAGELGAIQERQMQANIELQNVISGLFDQTGGTFETMIGNAKIFATQSITSIIKGLVSIVNYFIELYNDSILFRGVVAGLIAYWKTLLEVVYGLFKYVIDTAKIVGKALYSAMTFDLDGVLSAYAEWGENTLDIVKGIADSAADNAKEAMDKIQNDKLKPIELPVTVVADTKEKGKATPTKVMPNVDPAVVAAEKKAAFELAKYQTEQNAKAQKEILDDQKNSYADRIKALENYINTQKNIVDLSEKNELSQANLTASQRALIQAKANQQRLDLDKELLKTTLQLTKDQTDRELEIYRTNINNRLAVIKANSNEELALKIQLLDMQRDEEIKNAEKTGADVALIRAKYAQLDRDERKKQADYFEQQRQLEYENEIIRAELMHQDTLTLQIAQKTEQLQAIQQLEDESDAEFLNRKLTLQNEIQSLNEQMTQQTLSAVAAMAASFTDFFSTLGEENKAFLALSKATALAEIAIAKATAIAKGIAAAQAAPFPANLAAIATTTAAILSGFLQVNKLFKSSSSSSSKGYAVGGYVSGAGTGTSDSINARLSNGESVITAKATQMFAPILSEFNQIGGGVPIQTQSSSSDIQGSEMLTKSFTKAMQSLPNPIVSVQEINKVNNRVEVLEIDNTL